jgi:hypothetical protein
MKQIFIALLTIYSMQSHAYYRVFLQTEAELSKYSLEIGELFLRDGVPYVKNKPGSFIEAFPGPERLKFNVPTITTKTFTSSGLNEDVVTISPGKVSIGENIYKNVTSIECRASLTGVGGRVNPNDNPDLEWDYAYIYVVPSTNGPNQFNCMIDKSINASNIFTDWTRLGFVSRGWDTTSSKYRNLYTISVNSIVRPALNSVVGTNYGLRAPTFSTKNSVTVLRIATCIGYGQELPSEVIPRELAFTITNNDFSTFDIYSDSDCLSKIATYSTAGTFTTQNFPAQLISSTIAGDPTTRNYRIYFKGTLKTATGTSSYVTSFVGLENIIKFNKE